MSQKKYRLTIGMATYNDFHGAFFTIQSIRLLFPELMDQTEFVVIDNNPNSPHGQAVAELLQNVANSQYIPFDAYSSTSVRNQVFDYARGEIVLCLDSHVLLDRDSLPRLLAWFDEHPDCQDLLQGPMLYDDLKLCAVAMEWVWRDQMLGIWDHSPRGQNPNDEPFEIPLHGLGLFCCRRDAWLGFHPLFRGFGGEEGYIHAKFRKHGRKCWCLPFLRWNHRFKRPDGVPYRLDILDKIRNYVIGHIDLDIPVQPVIDHFKQWVAPQKTIALAESVFREMKAAGMLPAEQTLRITDDPPAASPPQSKPAAGGGKPASVREPMIPPHPSHIRQNAGDENFVLATHL